MAKGGDAKRLGPSFLLHCTAQFSVQHLPDFRHFFSGKNRSSQEKSWLLVLQVQFISTVAFISTVKFISTVRFGCPGFGVVDSRSVLPWFLRFSGGGTARTAPRKVAYSGPVMFDMSNRKRWQANLQNFPCFHASILLLMEEIPNNHLTCMKPM